MITAVLTLAATLATLFGWWIRRRSAEQDTPEAQYDEQQKIVDEALADGPAGIDAVNRLVDRGVALRLQSPASLPSCDSVGSPDSVSAGGATAEQLHRPVSGSTGSHAGNPPGVVHSLHTTEV